MQKIFKMFFILMLTNLCAANAQESEINWTRFASGCEDAFKSGKVFPLKFNDFYSGAVSATRVSISAKNKMICLTPMVATGKSDEDNTTILEFEDGAVTCLQTTDNARLSVESIKRTGYKVAGLFNKITGNKIVLTNCAVFPM